MKLAILSGFIGVFVGTLVPPVWRDENADIKTRLEQESISWEMNEELSIMRWKTLVGGPDARAIARGDVQFGLMQLAPGATYPGHTHPAPELYYIVEGEADWTVGEDTFEARPGTTIYTPSGSMHRMVNTRDEILTAIWVWWAPDGDVEVFEGGYRFTEGIPEQPPGARFPRVTD